MEGCRVLRRAAFQALRFYMKTYNQKTGFGAGRAAGILFAGRIKANQKEDCVYLGPFLPAIYETKLSAPAMRCRA